MNKKRVIIRSSQIFEEHIDTIEEIKECMIERLENEIKIVYDNTIITIRDNVAVIDRETSNLIIEQQKKHLTNYTTPYGILLIETEGRSVEINEDPFLMRLCYHIKIGEGKKYVNELQIVVADEIE